MTNTYKDVDEYLDTFEPLLFEEVKAQIAKKDDDEEGTALLRFYAFLWGLMLFYAFLSFDF